MRTEGVLNAQRQATASRRKSFHNKKLQQVLLWYLYRRLNLGSAFRVVFSVLRKKTWNPECGDANDFVGIFICAGARPSLRGAGSCSALTAVSEPLEADAVRTALKP